VPTTDEAAVRVHLAELSRVAGDHALALRRHLPRPTGVDPGAWVVAPSDGAASLVERLGGPGTDRSAVRLCVLHRVVVPRLVATWDADGRDAGVADRGVARTLAHAASDLADLGRDGTRLLDALLRDEPPAGRAALTWAVELEVGLVEGGGALPSAPSELPM
jgi:hypothetical protein